MFEVAIGYDILGVSGFFSFSPPLLFFADTLGPAKLVRARPIFFFFRFFLVRFPFPFSFSICTLPLLLPQPLTRALDTDEDAEDELALAMLSLPAVIITVMYADPCS